MPAAKSKQPKAESLETVLAQAIKTKDQDLLSKVFQTTNESVIRRTVERLPQTAVLPLLSYTVERFQSNPSMALQLTTWIQASAPFRSLLSSSSLSFSVITAHLAFLMAVPDLPHALGPLYSVIQSRLAVYQNMLRLQGMTPHN